MRLVNILEINIKVTERDSKLVNTPMVMMTHLMDSRCCWRLALLCLCWTVSISSLPAGLSSIFPLKSSRVADPVYFKAPNPVLF